jgi:hypothetical protein
LALYIWQTSASQIPQCDLCFVFLQALSQVVAKHGTAAKLNPGALPQLQSRKLCSEHFDINALFSVQVNCCGNTLWSMYVQSAVEVLVHICNACRAVARDGRCCAAE